MEAAGVSAKDLLAQRQCGLQGQQGLVVSAVGAQRDRQADAGSDDVGAAGGLAAGQRQGALGCCPGLLIGPHRVGKPALDGQHAGMHAQHIAARAPRSVLGWKVLHQPQAGIQCGLGVLGGAVQLVECVDAHGAIAVVRHLRPHRAGSHPPTQLGGLQGSGALGMFGGAADAGRRLNRPAHRAQHLGHAIVHGQHRGMPLDVLVQAWRQRLQHLDGPLIVRQRARWVAQVVGVVLALELGQSRQRLAEVQPLGVGQRVHVGLLLQRLRRRLHELPTPLGDAALQCVVDLEHHAVGQPSQFAQVARGFVARAGCLVACQLCAPGLQQGHHQAAAHAHRAERQCGAPLQHRGSQATDQPQAAERRSASGGPVALQPLEQHITRAGRSRRHRPPFAKRGDVGRQRVHAGVALGWRFGQSLQHDVVQVALQLTASARPARVGQCQLTGAGGLLFQHGARGFGGGGGITAIRALAGEQQVEQHTQAVDVRGRTHQITAHLLRAGVVRCERALVKQGGPGFDPAAGWVQGLGDAKVQQTHTSVVVHQHVAGLEVAVHQQVAVCVRDRIGQLQEQHQPVVQLQLSAGDIDGPALHPFHHKVGQAVVGDAGVQQPRNVRVRQPGQCLLLLGKARQHRDGVHAALEQFDCGNTLESPVVAPGLEDLAHAARAQRPLQPPSAQLLADAVGRWCSGCGRGGLQETRGRVGLERQQRGDLGAQHRVNMGVGQRGCALGWCQQQQALEQGPHRGPVGWCRGGLLAAETRHTLRILRCRQLATHPQGSSWAAKEKAGTGPASGWREAADPIPPP